MRSCTDSGAAGADLSAPVLTPAVGRFSALVKINLERANPLSKLGIR